MIIRKTHKKKSNSKFECKSYWDLKIDAIKIHNKKTSCNKTPLIFLILNNNNNKTI